MRYILQEDWCLRGYSSGQVQAVMNLRTRAIRRISQPMVQVLRLCDGCLDLDMPLFPESLAQLAEQAVEYGWVHPALEGERLAAEQRYRQTDAPLMTCVTWAVTGKCNARCRHCFQGAPDRAHSDLTTDDALTIIRELGRCQVSSVSLTGGEPLIRQDLPQLLEAMANEGIGVTALSTNGFLLDEDMARLFELHGMHPDVQVSFDGVGCHDFLRGVEGAEELALRAVEVCVSHGWHVTMAMCLHRDNLSSIRNTIRLAAKMGANKVRICPVGEMGTFAGGNGLGLLSVAEAYQLYYDLAEWYFEEKPICRLSLQGTVELDSQNPSSNLVVPLMHNCLDAANNKVCDVSAHPAITGDGRLIPCFALVGSGTENEYPKLTEGGLVPCMKSDAWRAFVNNTATDILSANPHCASCEFLKYCGCGCRAASLIAGNGQNGIDPARCEFFQGGWHERFAELCG